MKLHVPRHLPRTLLLCLAATGASLRAADAFPGAAEFHDNIRPILQDYCFDCHGDGASKGNVAFDQFQSDQAVLENRELWWKALKNLRAGLMPPPQKPRPSSQQQDKIARWVKTAVFGIDPQNPDPGRVTIRRLNRVEYHNTIRDLLGVDFDTQAAFPPDDTGFGFDTIGDVLTLSPMLLEKYLVAAEKIVAQAVPVVPGVVPEKIIKGKRFRGGNGGANGRDGTLSLSYYTPASVSNTLSAQWAGKYQLAVDLMATERFVDNVFDYNQCRLIFLVDGRELLRKDFNREGSRYYHFDFDQDWEPGDHQLAFQLQPLTPEPMRRLALSPFKSPPSPCAGRWRPNIGRNQTITPVSFQKRSRPPRTHAAFMPGNCWATSPAKPSAAQWMRKPSIAWLLWRNRVYSQPGKIFRGGHRPRHGRGAGVARASSSARKAPSRPAAKHAYPLVDEYLARLAPVLFPAGLRCRTTNCFRLAAEGRLRQNLSAQACADAQGLSLGGVRPQFHGAMAADAGHRQQSPSTPRSVLAREAKFDPETDKPPPAFPRIERQAGRIPDQGGKGGIGHHPAIRSSSGSNACRALTLTADLRRAMRMETEESSITCCARTAVCWNCSTAITPFSTSISRCITESPMSRATKCAASRCRRTVRAEES